MYTPTPVRDIKEHDTFLYSMKILTVVKAERNMLGLYDVWARTPQDGLIPSYHLVLEDTSALMVRT